MSKIKKLSTKAQDGSWSPFVDFGANAVNVDMLDGNNLEEEFHLGSPGITKFQNNADSVIITEEYRNSDTQTQNYYKMITTFENQDGNTLITQKIYWVADVGNETLKKTKKVVFEEVAGSLQIKETVEVIT